MNTITIVVVAVWNGLLFVALAAVIVLRKQVLPWITGLDRYTRNPWETGENETWAAFLAEHPELSTGRFREDPPERVGD